MKIILLCIILISPALAYDAVIKDKYGKITGYLDKKGDKTYFVDKYGKRGDYVENGVIKDKYGRAKGKIEKD